MGPHIAKLRAYEQTTSRDPEASPGAHRCDAFVAMLDSHGGFKQVNNVFVHIDFDALRRGYAQEGETSEVPSLGHIPVKLVQEMINDCILHVVVTSKTS